MKKIITGYFVVLATTIALAGSWSITPATSSTRVMPERGGKTGTAWATLETNGIGAIRKNAGKYYMALSTACNGATNPVHVSGVASDGGVDWLYIPSGTRQGLWIDNTGTAAVSLAIGDAAVNGKGITLEPGDNPLLIYGDGTPQAEINAITPGGANVLRLQEWP